METPPGSSHGPGGETNRSVASSMGMRSLVSTASTSLSLKSLSLVERQLGVQLPLNENGTKVILTTKDVAKIKDPETLRFLQQYGQMFVNEMRSEVNTPALSKASTPKKGQVNAPLSPSPPRKGIDASEIAEAMDRLAQEIDTFITATDMDGNNYQIAADATTGELHVPIDENVEAQDDQDLADFMDVLEIAEGNEEEMADSATASEGDDDEDGGEPDSEEAFQEKLRSLLSAEDEMKMLLGPNGDGTSFMPTDAPSANEESDDDGIPEELDGNHSEQPSRPESHSVANPSAFKFKSSWCSKPLTQQSQAVTPTGTPSGVNTSAMRLRKNKASPGKAVEGPTKALQKSSAYALDAAEEERINWILEHDDWETLCMGDDLDKGSRHETASNATSKASATSTRLSYDRASATSYAAAHAYGGDPVAQKRLAEIDAKLEKLQQVRTKLQAAHGGVSMPQIAWNEASDTSAKSPTKSSKSEAASAESTPTKSKKSKDSSPARQQQQQQQLDAVEARRIAAKKKGDEALKAMRVDRIERKKMAEINDRLKDISQQLDLLSTPPFSLETQYDLDQDPANLKWPAGMEPPEESEIQRMIAEAKEEQQLLLEA